MYGDTEVMRKHAGRLREQGVDLRALADRLVAQTESAGWAGRAADALAERIRERAAHLRDLATRHDGAAQSMDAHVQEVDRLKDAIADAERRADAVARHHPGSATDRTQGLARGRPARPADVATIDLGTPPSPPLGLLESLPRRISLTLPELRLLAECAGGAPLPFEEAPEADPAFGGRLGRAPAADDTDAYARAYASLHEPHSSLARRGLLVDTAADESLLGAVGLLATPTLALDLDVGVASARVKAWHRQRAGAVASLATTDGLVFELAWFPTDQWADELSRVAVLPEDHPVHTSAVPERVDLPYELVDAAVEAVRSHRPDLLSVLVAEHDTRGLSDLEVVTLLSALATEPNGRLRALVADVSAATTTVVGVVSWVLLSDGWRALRPRRLDGVDRIEVQYVEPRDLAFELAPVLAEVMA